MLKILADECVYKKTVLFLKSQGYDIISIKDLGLSGANDRVVLEEANKSNRILLTADQDFGNIIAYPPETHKGIIVLKTLKNEEESIHFNLLKVLNEVEPALLAKSLIVVDSNKYRIRHR